MDIQTQIISYLAIQGILLWIWSLSKKDSSLFDRVWGLSFVIISWIIYSQIQFSFWTLSYTLMITLWGLRLSWHITHRNMGKGEDARYASIRERHSHYSLKSFFMIFLFQSLLVWIVASPIIFGLAQSHDQPTSLKIIGMLVWAIGFSIEVCADQQLKTFITTRSSPLDVCDTKLWGISRHPNYLGDALLWWGLWIFTFSWHTPWTIASPILMSYLLRYFTGIIPLEEDQCAKKPNYFSYQNRVPIFLPRWPLQHED
jgi:steroid 5-alpha reductase family enzyme